jgi:hypothetical protein
METIQGDEDLANPAKSNILWLDAIRLILPTQIGLRLPRLD